MRTHLINQVQISETAFQWLQNKYSAVDAMNAADYQTFLADDCTLQFGNNPIAHGNRDIIEGIQHFWDAIGGLDHAFVNVLGFDHHFSAEALIDYTRKDGSVVPIPCVTVIERNEAGLAKSLKIFIDTTPIFNP